MPEILLQAGLPPSNLPYLVSAFVVTGLVFLGYALFIFRRRREVRAEIERLRRTADGGDLDGGPGDELS